MFCGETDGKFYVRELERVWRKSVVATKREWKTGVKCMFFHILCEVCDPTHLETVLELLLKG